jgi:glutamyl/glutaminyl-tRNA synthetase
VFEHSAAATLQDAAIAAEMQAEGARDVVSVLARELGTAPRLDRERFRAVANAVKAQTGQKGRALFHPIRIVLTGRAEGPELDLVVPAIDRGAMLAPAAGLPAIAGCRERARAFAQALGVDVQA